MNSHKHIEKTFAIIKPDAMQKGFAADIQEYLKSKGFKIIKNVHRSLTKDEINELYAEHITKSFYPEISAFMSSADVVMLVLERDNAVAYLREVLGATNSADAQEGTIRNLFGDKTMKMHNAIHGSDSIASAQREMKIFNLLDIHACC